MSLLVLDSLSKHFLGIRAVDNISLDAEEGSITALIGPNGAGKTTLINLVTGILAPSQGDIRFAGRSIRGWSRSRIASAGIRRTFQTVHLFPRLSVAENIEVGGFRGTMRRCPWAILFPSAYGDRAGKEGTAKILERLDLTEYADAIATDLPFGLQRKVEIGRALAGAPRLLLLDEPAAGMNEAETEDLRERMRAMRAAGHTILLIEHDMNLVMSVSDHVIVMDFGRLIAEGTPAQVRADPAVIRSYLGEETADGAGEARPHGERAQPIAHAMPALRVANLNAGYGNVSVLRDIGFELHRGEVLAVVGPNGAGKSTLVKTIAGAIRPKAGSIEMDGTPITAKPAHAIAARGILLVPETRDILVEMTVWENLRVAFDNLGERDREQEAFAEIYDLFPILAERRDQTAGNLSGGQQQMLAISRALLGCPEVLMLDEPSLGLAGIVIKDIYATLERLRARGLTILLVEQNANLAMQFADRVAVMVNGRFVLQGASADLRDDPEMVQHYLGM